MKKLLVALLFFCNAAYAQSVDWVARLRNNAGGYIIFMTIKGSCQHGHVAYGNSSSGVTVWGCWMNTDNHVMIFWNDNSNPSAFPYANLEINPDFKPNQNFRQKPVPGTF